MSDTPKLMASALRILAGDIQAPDDVPSMCLLNAASMIEQMEKDLNAERAAHLETRRALVELEKFAFMSDQEYAAKCYDLDALVATAVFTAARAAVAKADAKEGQP